MAAILGTFVFVISSIVVVGHRGLVALKTGSLVTLPGFLGQSCHLSADLLGSPPSKSCVFGDLFVGNFNMGLGVR